MTCKIALIILGLLFFLLMMYIKIKQPIAKRDKILKKGFYWIETPDKKGYFRIYIDELSFKELLNVHDLEWHKKIED